MDSHHLQRLREEQQRALENTDGQLQKFNTFKSDYVALQKRLGSLPDKTTHEVMVPLGSLAFMPGQLVHTNEILVLLGDNYFVERSAKQAVDIVSRRIKELDKEIESLQKQKELLVPRAQFTSDMINMTDMKGEQQEIIEPYNEEEEKQWRERHREYLRQAGQMRQEARAASAKSKETKVPVKTEENLWERLDQLELQEEKGRELENVDDDDGDNQSHSDSETVSLKDREDDSGDNSSSGEETDDEEEEEDVRQAKRVITFSHTKVLDKEPSVDLEDIPEDGGGEEIEIKSPADIYRLMKITPRSILKTTSTSSGGRHRSKGVTFGVDSGRTMDAEGEGGGRGSKKTKDTVTSQERQEVLDKPLVKAFTDTVVERPTQAIAGSEDQRTSTASRPMSKFRAAKQQSGITDSSHGQDSSFPDSGSTVPECPVPVSTSTRPVSRFRASRQKQTDTS